MRVPRNVVQRPNRKSARFTVNFLSAVRRELGVVPFEDGVKVINRKTLCETMETSEKAFDKQMNNYQFEKRADGVYVHRMWNPKMEEKEAVKVLVSKRKIKDEVFEERRRELQAAGQSSVKRKRHQVKEEEEIAQVPKDTSTPVFDFGEYQPASPSESLSSDWSDDDVTFLHSPASECIEEEELDHGIVIPFNFDEDDSCREANIYELSPELFFPNC
eukprot:comp20316_c0_seq3/m.40532 comp20316_c0_seq3/g.40532  ORF comp20316_c0_seq3/g.40532 comp20316_c0_seq3/m.40532 type:complete len:217 (-) comp20316_c0_seq3:72-722(-)